MARIAQYARRVRVDRVGPIGALAVVSVLAGACRPLPPRGTAAAEVAASTARVVHLPTDEDHVSVVWALDAGFARSRDGEEGLAMWAAGARADSTPQGVRVSLDVGPDLILWQARCAAPGDACVHALNGWLLPPTDAGLERPSLREDAAVDLREATADQTARWALRAWLFPTLPQGKPPAGGLAAIAVVRGADVRAWDDREVTRDRSAIGLSGPVDGARIATVMSASKALSSEIGEADPGWRPPPVTGRRVLVVPGPSVAWRVALPSGPAGTPAEETARRIVLLARDPDGDPPDCEAEVDGFGAPWAQARAGVDTVGAEAAGVPEAVTAMKTWLDAQAHPPDLALGRHRLGRHLDHAESTPGCALAWATGAVALGVANPLVSARMHRDDPVPDDLVAAVLPADPLRLVLVAPDPVAAADAVRLGLGDRVEEVRVEPQLPWLDGG